MPTNIGSLLWSTGIDNTGLRKDANQSSQLIGGVGKSADNVRSQLMGMAGALGLVAGGAAAISALKNAAKTINEFEQGIADLKAITGAAGDDLEYLKNQAIDLGAKTKGSAIAVVEAYKLIASAKPELLKDVKALNSVTEATLMLAQASGMEMPKAATALTDAMNQFGVDASKATFFVDALANGAKYGAAEIPAVTEALLKFGAVARTSNIDIRTSVGLVELLAENGLKGAEAGTALRNVLLKISAPDALPKEALEVFKNLGISMEFLNDKTIPIQQKLAALKPLLVDNANVIKVFGLENSVAALNVISHTDRLAELTSKMGEVGTAAEQASIKMDTVSGKTELLAAKYDSLILSVSKGGGPVSDFFKFWIDGASDALTELTRLNSSWDELYARAQGNGSAKGVRLFAEQFNNLAGTGNDAEVAKSIKESTKNTLYTLKNSQKKIDDEITNYNAWEHFDGRAIDILKERKETLVKEIAANETIILEANKKINAFENPDSISTPSTTGTETGTGADEEKKKMDAAIKAAGERLDYETEIGRKRITAQLEIEQNLLNLEKDSDEKLRKQAELTYKKTLNQIATDKAEQLKKYQELYGSKATLPQADQDIIDKQITTAEDTKNATITKINADAAKKIEEIWKKVNDSRLSDIEREKAAVDEKYKDEIKAAIEAKDKVLENTLKKSATNEKDSITRKYKLDELDFAQEIEMRKNEIALGGFNRENELAKLNFETFKKYQEQKIAILKVSGTPEDLKKAELLQTALDLSGLDENKRKSEEIANNFFDAANYATDLANALGDSNSALAEMLKGISGVANSIGDLVQKGAFSEGGMSTKDSISSIISGATQLIGIVVGQAAKNKKEMKDFYDSIISQQHQYNLALNEQILLNEQINGSVFFNDFAQTLSDSSKALADANDKRDEAMAKFWSSEAIVGKKNVVSGGNILSGIGAGAALGAGIGTLLGGPIIGTAVGALIGGIVGLFSKKKKDVVKPLLDVYPDLIDANGKFNIELAKTLIANKRVKGETEKILKDVIEWEEAAKKARDQIKGIIEDMAGTIGSDLRNALVDAFEHGTNSAVKFGESVKGIIENLVSQQLFNAIFGASLKKLEADLMLSSGVDANGDSTTGAAVDGNWVDDILRFYNEVPKLTDAFNEALGAVKVPGFDLFNGVTSSNQSMTSTGQIARALTEDTGSALMGLWRRALDEQITTTKTILKSNDFLSAISVNTLRTAENTEELKIATVELKGINDNTKKSYLHDLGV